MATRRNPSFFKVLIGDHFCDRLKIPGAFLRHFDGNVPAKCQLRIHTRIWPVDIEMVDHKFYFQNGWKEFVHEIGLKGCEFLVFFYDGITEFYVDIYGKDACKKEFAEVTKNYGSNCRETKVADSDDTSVEILDDFPTRTRRSGLGKKSSSPSSTSWSDRAVNEAMYKEPGITNNLGNDGSATDQQFLGSTSSSKMGGSWEVHIDDEDDDKEEESEENDETEADSEDEYEEEEEQSDDSVEILDEFPQCSKAKIVRKSSETHKRKINSSKAKLQSSIAGASTGELIARYRAKDYISKSDKPSCSIAMSPTYVHAAWAYFPKLFTIKHLHEHCSRITLRIDKRSWCVNLYHVKKIVRLQTGWSGFVHANNLKVGDVCVLVLIDRIRYVFDVTIFRATDAAT